MKYYRYAIFAVSIIATVTFSASFADVPVTIPLGASNQNNPFSLSPSTLAVKINDTIKWTNDDTAAHTVTTGKPGLGFDGRIDSGIISPGETFSYTFTKSGLYSYYCIFHPWMTGFVNVETSVPEMPIGILASTDKQVYYQGDVIQVTGQVSEFIANKQVTVWVTDSKGTGISVVHTETRTGREFAADVPISGKLWVPGNNYTIYAQYGPASSVATIPIQYEPRLSGGLVQNVSNDVHQDTTLYLSSYKKVNPDSNNYITSQTGHRIYTPDSLVTIYGSIWDGVFSQIGGGAYLATIPVSSTTGNTIAELVLIQIKDSHGNVVSTSEIPADNSGNYIAQIKIPTDSSGMYHVQSQLKTKEGLLSTLDRNIVAKLGSSVDFMVARPVLFSVPTNNGDYNIGISSNSTVSNFVSDLQQKKISFDVQGERGTHGTTDVTIPKLVLGGTIQVLVDGVAQPYGSDGVIVTSDTASETGLEINYHHSMHTIDLVGTSAAEPPVYTQAVPEFSSVASLVLGASVASIIVLSYGTRKF